MLPGEYKFKTDKEEHIVATLGEMNIQLPKGEWKKIHKGKTAIFPAGVEFQLRIEETVSYVCFYQ